MTDIIVKESLLPKESCDYLSRFCIENPDAFKNPAQVIPAFKDRTLAYKNLPRGVPNRFSTVERILNYARFIGQYHLNTFYSTFCYPENTELTIWRQGQSMSPHADNCWQPDVDEETKKLKHPTRFRSYSGIFYLNDDFDGGEIYFKNLNYKLTPKKGMFIGFRAGLDHTHEVLPVQKKNRYTIAVWYSNLIEYAE